MRTDAPAPPANPSGTAGFVGGLNITPDQIKAGIAAAGGGSAKGPGSRPVPSLSTFGRQGFGTTNNSLSGDGQIGKQKPDTGSTRDPNGNYQPPAGRTVDDVKLDVQRMSDDELAALGKRLVAAHLLPPDWALSGGRDAIEKVWGDLVDRAADYHQANPTTDLTPQDMIDLYSGQSADGKNAGTTTSTSTSYGQPMTADAARRKLESMMTAALGRAPTGKEADDFQAALNEAQANNPSTTVTTTGKDASGNTTSTTRPSGGFNPDDFANTYAREHVQNTDEYRHYQAATTYYQALLGAIKGPPV